MTPTDIFWGAKDGTRLHARRYGPATSPRPPVLCLPGLTRNGRDFERLAQALAGHRRQPRQVITVDYRGRGLSAWADPASYRVDQEAEDVLLGLDSLGIDRADVVGTSRGGLIAMFLAANAGHRLASVVLNDIGPVIETGGLRAIRDRMAANQGQAAASWPTAVAALRAAMAPRFPAVGDATWHDFARQIYREDSDGRPVLDHDPALLDTFRSFDDEAGVPPFWTTFEALRGHRLLTVRGEHSDLLSERTLTAMAERIPEMEILHVVGEGHAPLLMDRRSIAALVDFLNV